MSKRLFWLLALSVTLTLVVAACGGGATPAPEAAPAEEEAPAEAAPLEEEVEEAPAEEEVEAAPAEAETEPTEAEAETTEEAVSVQEDTLDPAATEEEAETSETEAESEPAPTEEAAESAPTDEEAPAEETTAEHAADLGSQTAPAGAALTAQEAYELALAEAQAWQSDAVLIEIGSSLLGPVDAEGKSESWSFVFWSPSANELNSMLFVNGTLNATPVPNTGFPKPIPAMDSVTLDTGRIYGTAATAGGNEYIDEGYYVSASLTTYPLDEEVPTWYVHYNDPQDDTVAFSVIIDARTGEIIQALATE